MTEITKSFTNWRSGAFYLKFPNGNELSTTFAASSYSDNHEENSFDSWRTIDREKPIQSDTVEIMVLKCTEKLSKKIYKKYGDGNNSVIGYLPIEKWLEIVNLMAKSPTTTK